MGRSVAVKPEPPLNDWLSELLPTPQPVAKYSQATLMQNSDTSDGRSVALCFIMIRHRVEGGFG